jgi:tetratricopeptide (TPR) repeat protein
MGLALSSKTRRDEALGYLQRALTLLEPPDEAASGSTAPLATAPQTPVSQASLAAVLNHLGALYLDRGEPAHALDLLQRSLHLREGLYEWNPPGDQSGLAQTLNNLGAAYTKLNEPDQAAQCLSRTLLIYSQLGDSTGEAAARCNLALLNLLLGQYDQAVTNMVRTVELDREINSPDLASHQALLARIETERAMQPRTRTADVKPSLLDRLRKSKT